MVVINLINLTYHKGGTMNLSNYQKFIHVSRYARYIPELKRRETWDETVKKDIVKRKEDVIKEDGYGNELPELKKFKDDPDRFYDESGDA